MTKGQTIGFQIADVTLVSCILTFFIASWEELWFRGLYLNYLEKSLSPLKISLIVGSLFMLMHLLNPAINLLISGPALFFASALLCILYFKFQNIWLPVGLHFGNNVTSLFFPNAQPNDHVFCEDGYLTAFVLASLFFYFVYNRKPPVVGLSYINSDLKK